MKIEKRVRLELDIMNFKLLLFVPLFLFALEKDYQVPFCNDLNGTIEYRLDDLSRVDCLTDEFAIEVEFAKKWKEAIGQALFYGIKTNRTPAIALIVDNNDTKHINRLNVVSERYGIKVFYIDK